MGTHSHHVRSMREKEREFYFHITYQYVSGVIKRIVYHPLSI